MGNGDAEKQIHDLFYDAYNRALDDTEGVYRRAAILLTTLPILGAVTYSLGRLDLIQKPGLRLDVVLYYLSLTGAWLCVARSVVFLVWSIKLGSYPCLAGMDQWHLWLKENAKRFTNDGQDLSEKQWTIVAADMIRARIPLLAAAQATCADNNEKRRKLLQRAMGWASYAVAFVGLAAVTYLVIRLIG